MSADDPVGTKKRFADNSNQQLETIVQDKDAENNRRSIDQAVRLFRKYLQEKELGPAFESYDKQTFYKTLCRNYAEARTVDGELYKKLSLRHGLNRYLGNIFYADLTKDAEIARIQGICESFICCLHRSETSRLWRC